MLGRIGLSLVLVLWPFYARGAWGQAAPANDERKPLPAATQTNPLPLPRTADPQEAFVIQSSSLKVNFENDGTETREMQARVQVLSNAGVQRWGLLSFAYQKFNQDLEIDYVRVKKADGSVVITPVEEAQEITSEISRIAPFYTDLREKHVAVKGLEPGDVLEYSFHLRVTKMLVPGQFWMEYRFTHDHVVLEETLEVSIPAERPIKIRNRGPKFEIVDKANRRIYRWTNSNPKSKEEEESDDEATTWKQVRGQQDQPDILLSSFHSWDEVGRWYDQLQQERIKPTPEIQAKAAQLTKTARDDLAKLQAIYGFVSTKYRYIGVALGMGRYQPHFAAEVMDNGYGDCKDKHTLLAALLMAAGFKVYPALINAQRDLDLDVPSPGQFDHVISLVGLGDGKIWLDTTPEVAPFAFLVGPLRGKRALVVRGDSSTLEMTPLNPDFKSSQTFEIKAKLDDSGTLTASADSTVSGNDLEVLLRTGFRSVPMPQWQELAQRLSYVSGFGGEVSEVNASAPEDLGQPFRISYKYTRNQYGDWGNHRISPPLPVMNLPDIKQGKKAPSAPLWLGVPGEIDCHSSVELPKAYTLEVPANVDLKEEFGEYHAEYSLKDGVFTADRRLVLHVAEVPIAAYEKYKAFRKKIDDDRDQMIQLTSLRAPQQGGRAGAASGSGEVAMNHLRQAIWAMPDTSDSAAAQDENDARDAMTRNDIDDAIEFLRSAVEKDPKFARAWLLLASIRAMRFEQDAALDAYHSAVKADPTQAISYKLLGFTLMSWQKFDEAVSVWQELMKSAPEDRDAEANLASALLALKRYSEAASAAESAVKRAPDHAFNQMLLGRAYLGAGNREKALAAFEQAVKLDSRPSERNNVAYELAEQEVGLPAAKEYAEGAVREEEETTGKLQLADLRLSDLNHTGVLATFWDTLGWVYFRMNDLVRAEKYLSAAWELTQNPIIGRHLAQVYEKQGKTSAALHLYQLVYAATAHRTPLHAGARIPASEAAPDPDLKRLGAKPDPMNAQSQLNKMRTFALPKLAGASASADYFVLFGPGGKVEARFISGSDSLKAAEKAIEHVNYGFSFPDAGPTRIARKALVACYSYSGCSIVFITQTAIPATPPLMAAAP